jgi:hypothetical protein
MTDLRKRPAAVIRRRLRRLLALLRSPDLNVLDTSVTPSQTRPEAELATPQPGVDGLIS